MKKRVISEKALKAFEHYLVQEERSAATIQKYMRDVRVFAEFAEKFSAGAKGTKSITVTKEMVMAYKNNLIEKRYAVRSINSMLASINSFLVLQGWEECRVKNLKLQRSIYSDEKKTLTKAEYMRLIEAAGEKSRLAMILRTIGGTGIRISELSHFTVEAVKMGEVTVSCKGKMRRILIPGKLRKLLLVYASGEGIRNGIIFRTRSGKPVDRSNVWFEMKRLCKTAGVDPEKVFPHNLRKLFARVFYEKEKDIAKLADILGHGSVDTTRIYIMTTGREHRRTLEKLGLVV